MSANLPSVTSTDLLPELQQVKRRAELLEASLASVLIENQDYGPAYPGDTKKTLLKPGVEKLCAVFRIVPSVTCQYVDLPGGHLRVVAVCEVMNSNTELLARTEAVASTMEAKYRFKGSTGRTCPKCGAETIFVSKKQYGGGYYCKKDAGGCGESFKPGTREATDLDLQKPQRKENDSPADQWNTVSKMAQKRAIMSAVLLATGASSLFAPDEPDAPDHVPGAGNKAEPEPAQQRASARQLRDLKTVGELAYGADRWPDMRQKWIDQNCGRGLRESDLSSDQVEGIIAGIERVMQGSPAIKPLEAEEEANAL